MRTHARAVVIGGGVVGVSTLYHLAKKGWTDSVLIERSAMAAPSLRHQSKDESAIGQGTGTDLQHRRRVR